MKCSLKTGSVWLAIGLLICMTVEIEAAFARPLDPISAPEVAARLQELEHAVGSVQYSEEEVEEDWTCIRSEVTLDVKDPLTRNVRKVVLPLYRPVGTRPTPLVVIVPTIEGTSFIERSVASSFCDNDIAAIIADVNSNAQPPTLPSWDLEDRNNRFASLAIRSVLDYAESLPKNFDKQKFGLMGLSLGGITAALMAGVEPQRLRAIVVTVGGGNLPYILANSDSDKVAKLRVRRMKHLGLTKVTEYENLLRSTIKYDPFYFSAHSSKDRILMVMAKQDTKIPYIVQREQYEAFGKPDYMLFSGGHVGSIVSLTFLYLDTVIDFMNARFSGKYGIDGLYPRIEKEIDLDKLGL